MYKIASLALVVLLFGCNGLKTTENQKKGNTPSENKILINDVWALTEILEVPLSDDIAKRPQLEFNHKENSFSGNNSCNQITGNLKELTNTDMEFGIIKETKMACKEMKLASTFVQQLRNTRSYKVTNGNLHLLDADEKVLLRFKKID